MKCFGASCIYLLSLCLLTTNVTSANDNDFNLFWRTFTKAVTEGNTAKIANYIRFPIQIYGITYSLDQFVNNKDESINFFNGYVARELSNSRMDDLIYYGDVSELGADVCPEVTWNGTIYECDIINENGGPATRLLFAKNKSKFELFCVAQ